MNKEKSLVSKWMSDIVRAKMQRQALGPQSYGHLQAFEGGKVAEGFMVRETLLDKIRRFCRPAQTALGLRVLNHEEGNR